MKEIKRFGDLESEKFEDREWVNFSEIVDNEILVEDFIEAEGDFGRYVIILFEKYNNNTTKYLTATGAQVIVKKLRKARELDVFPLIGKIIKQKKYYDII